MHRAAAIAFVAAFGLSGQPGALKAAEPPMSVAAMAPSMANLITPLLPQVVSLSVLSYAVDAPAKRESQNAGQPGFTQTTTVGSGFIIDDDGLIVTNQHVVNDAATIIVVLSDGTRLKGTLVAADKIIDIALVKVNAGKKLPAVTFGDSGALQPGDRVFAIGNPLGLGESVSSGIVSALDRDIHSSPYDAYIQTDAAINHGNSGGALFNREGQVIGMNTALIAPSGETGSIGLGFAIPGADVQFVVAEMRKYGRVRPGWLGVDVQKVTHDLADGLGLPEAGGSVVLAVELNSPAARAGLHFGDVILKVGDVPARDVRTLVRAIAVAPLGSPMKLDVWRDGHEQDMTAEIMENPAAAASTATDAPVMPPHVAREDMGLEVAPVTEATRRKFGLDGKAQGLVVTNVVPNSVAAERDIVAGAMVLRVDQAPVATLDEWHHTMALAWGGKRANMLVLLRDKTGLKLVALPTGQRPQ